MNIEMNIKMMKDQSLFLKICEENYQVNFCWGKQVLIICIQVYMKG